MQIDTTINIEIYCKDYYSDFYKDYINYGTFNSLLTFGELKKLIFTTLDIKNKYIEKYTNIKLLNQHNQYYTDDLKLITFAYNSKLYLNYLLS
jgi:hypothetical protein